MKFAIKKIFILIFILSLGFIIPFSPTRAQTSNEEFVDAHFAPELLPGSNFTWRVNEWEQMDDLINPEANYVPKTGDIWTVQILKPLPSIPISTEATWDILAWHIEKFTFPALNSKDNSDLLMEISVSNHSFFLVFGNESDNGYNWKLVNFLLLLPFTVEDENGQTESFGKFCEATFGGIDVEVDVNTSSSTDLKVKGSISGEYQDTEISLESHLGVREEFTYKTKPTGSQTFTSVLNISLIDSVFAPPNPVILGYSNIITIGIILIGIVFIIVRMKVKKKFSPH